MNSTVGWALPQLTGGATKHWAVMALLYGLACGLSLWMAGQTGHVATLWFGNPVGSVALMLAPWTSWPSTLLALGLANGAANWGHQVMTMGSLLQPTGPIESWTLWSAFIFVPGNLLEMSLSAVALRRWCPNPSVLLDPWGLTRALVMGGALPSVPSAVAGATLLYGLHQGPWISYFSTWLSGSVIGSIAVLPLALAVGLHSWRTVAQTVLQPRTLMLMVAALSLSILALTTLPFPFVAVSLLMALLSLVVRFHAMALTTVLVGLLQAVLIRQGVLIAPPSTQWWGDALFYLAVLESLLPGVLLSAAIGGRETMIMRLRQSEQRLRSLYVQSPVMLQSTDTQGRIEQISQYWLHKLGYREEEVIGRSIHDFLTPDSIQRMGSDSIPGATVESAWQMRCSDGRQLDIAASSLWERDESGRPLRQLAVLKDVTELKHLTRRSHYAEHDPLTGLPNRILLQDRLDAACLRAKRLGRPFAVGFLDLDGFKEVNDRFGHEMGDALLREAARRLSSSVRTSDTVSRLAGDEFVLLLSDSGSPEVLMETASRILNALTRDEVTLVTVQGLPVPTRLNASMGLALYGLHGDEANALLKRADAAMYQAKRSGSGLAIFDSDAPLDRVSAHAPVAH